VHRRRTVIIGLFAVLGIFCGSIVAAPYDKQEWRPSPSGAAFRSFALPGWGQAYNRKPLKAVIFGGIEEGLLYGIYRQHQLFRDERRAGNEPQALAYREDRNRLTWMLAGALILSMTDAYVDAHLFGFDVSEKLTVFDRNPGEGVRVRLGLIWR